MTPGDTTEQVDTGSGSDAKAVSDSDDAAAGKEVDTLMSHPVASKLMEVIDDAAMPCVNVTDDTAMPCALPPSPPMDVDHIVPLLCDRQPNSSELEVDDALKVSGCDESAGDVSCVSSMLTATDDTPDNLQSSADLTPGFFNRAKHMTSAASKYRLRCQCGAKKCRQYLYQ